MSPPRRLAVYTGGFLGNRRIRAILAAHGWQVGLRLRPWRADAVGVWGRRPVSRRGLWVARRFGLPVLNVEDAWLRSVRPGHTGAPPIGLLVDLDGLHYDPANPSALERRLAAIGPLDAAAAARARDGIAFLAAEGLSKYCDWQAGAAPPPAGAVIVVDQTRGDAALAASGAGPDTFARMLAAARAEHPGAPVVLRTHPVTAAGQRGGHYGTNDLDDRTVLHTAPIDPWRLLAGARAVYTVSSQLGFEAILAGHRPVVFGQPFYAGWGLSDDRAPPPRRARALTAQQLFTAAMLDYPAWYDPHRGGAATFETAARALAAAARAWREDRRGHVCAGMRPWKHAPVSAFLTGAAGRPVFEADPARALAEATRLDRPCVIWAGQETQAIRARAAAQGVPLWRMEDGFLRSVGLGAQLLPAASLVIDDLGIYFDPTRESRLERHVAAAEALDPGARHRAEALARAVVALKLTKYNVGAAADLPDAGGRRLVLVPGQVEDDASIRLGCSHTRTNLGLLERARALFPDAFLVFKPHPDIEAGLRAGRVAEADLARLADHVAHRASAAHLLDRADVVVTMTSLMGFEGLLRGCEVHCLGVPFYAGWGLTTDHAEVPARRQARPDLAALVHAALIAYPRYFDAQTGTACPPEVIVDRLAGRAPAVSRHATRRHKVVAAAQDRLRRFARLWR